MIMFLLVDELGSGEFGVVWLAEAVGISAFHPRDMLKEKESRSRFSIFNRMEKRNSYVYCKEVTKVAVKGIKGLCYIHFKHLCAAYRLLESLRFATGIYDADVA